MGFAEVSEVCVILRWVLLGPDIPEPWMPFDEGGCDSPGQLK